MPHQHHLKHWLLALRPKTLSISVAPVVVACALAWNQQQILNWVVALACLMGAMLIQIGTNLHNDAADFERGADSSERIGPHRATAQGWFTARQVRQAALISFSGAFLIGIYLVWIGGWPIVILGLLSLLAGYAYTGGPIPIAYTPSGELFVFLFFGLVAVTGSYYLQVATISWQALHVASAIGLLAAAILLVNNYRDLDTDQKANKLTLAFYLGRQWTKGAYLLFMLFPFALAITLYPVTSYSWMVVLLLPFTSRLIWRFYHEPVGPEFNQILASTAKHQLLFSLLLAASLLPL